LERRDILTSVWKHLSPLIPTLSCPQHAPATPLNSSAQHSTALGQEYRVPEEEERALLIHPA